MGRLAVSVSTDVFIPVISPSFYSSHFPPFSVTFTSSFILADYSLCFALQLCRQITSL
jgi:hypothetical protein